LRVEENKYFSVDKIVKSLLVKLEETGLNKYAKFVELAFDFLDELTFDTKAQEVRTISLEMQPDRTICLPRDYMDYIKIGIQIGDKIKVLSQNNKMSLLPPTKDTPKLAIDALDVSVRIPFNNYINEYGEHQGGIYGYGNGGYYGDFVVDEQKRIIRFSSDMPVMPIYIEYISNCSCSCEEDYVHPYAKKAMEYYILWQHYHHKGKNYVGEAQRNRDEYYNELRKTRARLKGISIQDIVNIMERNTTNSIR
jgi:hypothetical protein